AGGAYRVAHFRHAERTRGGAADGAGRGAAVRWTRVRDPVAALRDVARTGRGTAHGGALRVAGTRGARAGADLGRVADAGRRPALRRARQERVGGTARARAGARLGDVADAGRGAADGAGVAGGMAARPVAVAGVGGARVAVVG